MSSFSGPWVRLFSLDGMTSRPVERLVLRDAGRARVSVVGGVARMIALRGNELVLVEAREDDAREVGFSEVFHGTRMVVRRPTWNGMDVIITGVATAGIVGPLRLGGETVSWSSVSPEWRVVQITSEAATGFTEMFYRSATGANHVTRRDAAGAPIGSTQGVVLAEVGFEAPFFDVGNATAFGWLDADGGDQPIVVAGFATDDDGYRLKLQRFREDGAPGAGFSSPLGGTPRDVDLSTEPVPPLASSYGVVAASRGGAPLFHGGASAFVGGAQELPFAGCAQVSIAAGPCGYVIACLDDDSRVQLALAVAPSAS